MTRLLRNIGPAIIVAAIVLGPGSILTSSRVGSQFGYAALPVLALATILMIAMVALAARIGVIYDNSPCDQLAARLRLSQNPGFRVTAGRVQYDCSTPWSFSKKSLAPPRAWVLVSV